MVIFDEAFFCKVSVEFFTSSFSAFQEPILQDPGLSYEACPAALLLALLSCGARAASARRHELLEQWNDAFAAPCRQASFYHILSESVT